MAGAPSGGLLRGGIKKVPKNPSKTPMVREPKHARIPGASGSPTRSYGKTSGGFGPPSPSPFSPGTAGYMGPLGTPAPPAPGNGSAFGPGTGGPPPQGGM